MKPFQLDKYGFSLTELAISLTIIGIIVSSAISVVITQDDEARVSQTESKLIAIEDALAGFVALNKRLPCPADPSFNEGNANYGQEQVSSTSQCLQLLPSNKGYYLGVLPFKTLQLPNSFADDGWGRRLTYVVSKNAAYSHFNNEQCTNNEGNQGGCFVDMIGANKLSILDGSLSQRTASAVYVILSHGANGAGAFIKSSNQIISFPKNERLDFKVEQENAHIDSLGNWQNHNATFIKQAIIKPESGTYFDDIIVYGTKQNILDVLGVRYFDPLCIEAQQVLNQPGSNACTDSEKPEECLIFANEVAKRCLH